MDLKVATLVAALCVLPCFNAQNSPYTVVVMRTSINTLTLRCRSQDGLELTDPQFWLNDTQQELREKLGEGKFTVISATTLTFVITRELEGEYFCGPIVVNPIRTSLIAHPTNIIPLNTRRTALSGEDAMLLPLISPGALLQRYFIDWEDGATSETLARINGPRDTLDPSFTPNEKYSVDPDTFKLTIRSVTFEDRGSYRGVLGVRDPAGMPFTYEQTRTINVTLVVYVRPVFREAHTDKVVSLVNGNRANFTSIVEGYPRPTFEWYHNGQVARNEKYTIQERVISEDPYLVESTLMISELSNMDSGGVSCNATVTTEEGETYVVTRTAQLSVLGELNRVTPFVTLNREVILRVNLARPIAAEVQLFIKYKEQGTGRHTTLTTPDRYAQSDEITYIDESVPYEKFSVDIALVFGPVRGPLRMGGQMYDLSRPTELHPILMNFVLPGTLAVVIILIVGTIVIIGLCICFCRKPCLQCCFHINREGTRAVVIDKAIPGGLENIRNEISGDVPPQGATGAAPFPGGGAQTDSTKRKSCLRYFKGLCFETRREKKAKHTYRQIKNLLERSDTDNNVVSSITRLTAAATAVATNHMVDGKEHEDDYYTETTFSDTVLTISGGKKKVKSQNSIV